MRGYGSLPESESSRSEPSYPSQVKIATGDASALVLTWQLICFGRDRRAATTQWARHCPDTRPSRRPARCVGSVRYTTASRRLEVGQVAGVSKSITLRALVGARTRFLLVPKPSHRITKLTPAFTHRSTRHIYDSMVGATASSTATSIWLCPGWHYVTSIWLV